MTALILAQVCAILIWLALIAYAALGGADFGGGVWDALARGRLAERQHKAIANALGPVWEANNVWLIYVIVLTWSAFRVVYATVSTALFIPLTLALIGIIFRGAAFAFHSSFGDQAGIGRLWSHVFSGASIVTPFLLGTVAGAIAGGDIRVDARGQVVDANFWSTWTTPFALACGAFAVGLCAVLAATYLTVEAQIARDGALVNLFRRRAIIAGAVTALLGALAAALAYFEEPVLWDGLIGKALPLSLGAVLIGLAAAASLWFGRYALARAFVVGEAVCIIAAWGLAQYPYLIVPDLTLTNAAGPVESLGLIVVVSVIGLAVLIPSLWYLFRVFKSGATRRPKISAEAFALSLASPSAVPTPPAALRASMRGNEPQSSSATQEYDAMPHNVTPSTVSSSTTRTTYESDSALTRAERAAAPLPSTSARQSSALAATPRADPVDTISAHSSAPTRHVTPQKRPSQLARHSHQHDTAPAPVVSGAERVAQVVMVILALGLTLGLWDLIRDQLYRWRLQRNATQE